MDGFGRVKVRGRDGMDEVVGMDGESEEEEGVRRQTGEWESTTATTHTWEWIGMRWNGIRQGPEKECGAKGNQADKKEGRKTCRAACCLVPPSQKKCRFRFFRHRV